MSMNLSFVPAVLYIYTDASGEKLQCSWCTSDEGNECLGGGGSHQVDSFVLDSARFPELSRCYAD